MNAQRPPLLLLLPCLVFLLLSRVMARADQLQLQLGGEIISNVQQMPSPPLPEALRSMSGAEPPDPSGDPDLAIELHRSLRFDPPHLDFGTWSVGTARSHTVTLVNQNANRSVYLSSVSGRTPAFYSSFFEEKVVPPQGNTTFSVVFLPRVHGEVAADLLVHTSFGQARLLVRGEGRDCPYRLKPIVGVRAPLNATLTPEIHMYNPHDRPLQILEVYSSGGQFQLELPSGGQEGPQALWEIPGHSMKPVIRIRFHGRSAGNHTAYIRIKISEQPKGALAANENVLVIPVEFEILPQHGLYAENPLLDFGRLATQNKEPLQLKLELRNSHERRVHELISGSADDLHNRVPGLSFDPSDASITLDPQLFDATTKLDELLMLRAASKRNASQSHEFSVMIRAEVFKGTLSFDRNITTFVTQAEGYTRQERRLLVVRNDFHLPLALLHVSVDRNDSSVLEMVPGDGYTGEGMVLAPGQSLSLLQLQVLNDSANFHTALHIRTNITMFEVPVVICSGLLHVSTHDSGRLLPDAAYNLELNLGAVPLAEMSHDGYIVLRNRNPLAIKLSTWDFQSPQGVYFHTTFMGCLRGAALTLLSNETVIQIESGKFKFCSHLNEGDVAVFQVAIQSYITEHHTGTLKIWSAYELITTTVKFRTWMGKLEVDQEQLYFKNCFPGKLCSSDLSIRSTFQHPIHVTSINFTDAGLRFEDFHPKGSTIAPEAITKVGRIYFEPALLCQNRCYIPQDEKTSALAFPVPHDTKGGRNNNLHFDETELRRRTELFRHLKWYFQTISFTLNSREVRQFLLQLIIDIEWPKLVVGRQMLPTIEVGKAQELPVLITNPADSPILVDYFLADPQFAKETQLSLPLEVVDISSNCYLTDKSVFSLPEAGQPSRKPVVVAARSSLPVMVRFEAHAADTHCTILHIRNNLTLYEAVWLSARTVQSQFRFGNRKPGSSTPLLFEVSEKHLATSCAQQTLQDPMGNTATTPPVIAKRTFTARNTGEIPIWIETFLIGDQPCEGYGFKVLDCTSFELKANQSKKIEIAFRPDFTSVRISRPLTLRTNLSYDVGYVLLAQLPPVSLDQCAELLPRPPWEQRIRNAAIILLAITFVFVLVAAHIDYGNILVSQSALYISRDKGPVHPTFNLRNIGVKSGNQAATSTDEPNGTSIAPTIKTGIRSSYHQQKVSGSGGSHSNIKKRSVKKVNTNGNTSAVGIGRNMSLSDISWPLQMSGLKASTATSKNTPTFSERNFKLRLEADKLAAAQASTTSSSSVSSTESSAKSTPPKAAQSEKEAAVAVNTTNPKKQQQRALKKSKNMSQTSNDRSNEKEERLEKKSAAKSMKTFEKTSSPEVTASSAKPTTDVVKGPAGTGPTSSDTSPTVAKDSSIMTRKHGKTPGRERRKDASSSHSNSNTGDTNGHSTTSSTSTSSSSSSSSKRSERKQKNKAANSLNFNALPAFEVNSALNVTNCITSPWETGSQVLFSDVLQLQNSPVSSPDCPNSAATAADITINSLMREYKNQPDSEYSLMEIDLKRNLQTQQANTFQHNTTKSPLPAPTTPMDKNNTAELGPIGSKKSPSSTPLWEPVTSSSATTGNLNLPKPTTISNNSSFFSNLLPTTTYGYSDNGQQYMGVPAGLYELKKAQEDLQRQWQTNEYILSLRQQQLQAQQQLLQGNVDSSNSNWALNSPTWSPMGYGQNVVNAQVAPQAGPWQSAGVVRPPPGLESSYQNPPNQTAQQQQQQVPINTNNDGLSISQANNTDMQTFDPFSSLSSIWSDNWNKNINHNNHGNNAN